MKTGTFGKFLVILDWQIYECAYLQKDRVSGYEFCNITWMSVTHMNA